MEKWCIEMGFNPEDIEGFIKHLKRPGTTRIVWNHVIKHVRPRDEVQIIKKQCLLHKLRTSKHVSKIEVPLRSVKDYDEYIENKKKHYNLKKLLQDIEKKKESIKGHIEKLQQSGDKIIHEEEVLKQELYILSQLKKKKLTVTRQIDKLIHDTKVLNLITNEPNKIVGVGPHATAFDREVLMFVKQLPDGSECQTILSKMAELSSELPPVPYWDRTEVLTLMEKTLISMVKKMNICKANLEKEEVLLDEVKQQIVALLSQCNGDDMGEDDLLKILQDCENDYIDNAILISDELKNFKSPYTLDIQHQLNRRLQRQIDEKVNIIKSLLPVECEEIKGCVEIENSASDFALLPLKLPVDKLFDSVSDEVALFVKTFSLEKVQRERNYSYIRMECTSESQLFKLKEDLKLLSKLILFEERLCSLEIPTSDDSNERNFKEKSDKVRSKVQEILHHIENITEKLNKKSKKLKEAFFFLRNEPLNKKLTGIEVAGEDISYWLMRYKESIERLNHEEWLQKNIEQLEQQSSQDS